jgi:hypothetical protein
VFSMPPQVDQSGPRSIGAAKHVDLVIPHRLPNLIEVIRRTCRAKAELRPLLYVPERVSEFPLLGRQF